MRMRTAAILMAAGTAGAGVMAIMRGFGRRTEPSAPPGVPRDEGLGYPIVIHRLDGFLTLHSASFVAVRGVLPSELLHPVRLPNGRALVGIGFYQKRAATAGWGDAAAVLPPYAELAIVAVVARRPLSIGGWALRLLRSDPELGAFPIQCPVTNPWWRDAARSETGMPMFVADVAVDRTIPERLLVRVSEDDRLIVEVAVASGGILHSLDQAYTLFGARDGALVGTRNETSFVGRARVGGARLVLGTEHPVATALAELDIAPDAFATFAYANGESTLHRPVRVGSARPYPCHPGLDHPTGRYTVRYAGTGAIREASGVEAVPDLSSLAAITEGPGQQPDDMKGRP